MPLSNRFSSFSRFGRLAKKSTESLAGLWLSTGTDHLEINFFALNSIRLHPAHVYAENLPKTFIVDPLREVFNFLIQASVNFSAIWLNSNIAKFNLAVKSILLIAGPEDNIQYREDEDNVNSGSPSLLTVSKNSFSNY